MKRRENKRGVADKKVKKQERIVRRLEREKKASLAERRIKGK